MAAKVISNVVKRGKDVFRLVLSKQTGADNKIRDVRQPTADLLRLQSSHTITPIRALLFTSRVSYRTIASQLRRRAAFEFGRPRRLPFFGFVGLALATSTQNEDDNLSAEIRDVLQKKITDKTSPFIQQLSLNSFDLGEIIGRGCNAVVFEAKYSESDHIEGEITSLENSSDFVQHKSLSPLPFTEDSDEEEDKWFPPDNTEEHFEGETIDNISINTSEDQSPSFIIIDEERRDSFSVISSEDKSSLFTSEDEDGIILEPMSISVSSMETVSVTSKDSDLSDSADDNWSYTSSEDEDDKWSLLDELEFFDGSNRTKFDLAVKMMFNYEVESNADSIIKAMEKETVPARVPVYQLGDPWFIGNRVRLKSLPHHPNIVDMVGAFVDPFNVPQMSVAMDTYPAALPKRLHSDGLGRNMTMYLVMKRYDMTLRQYLEEKDPNIRTRCLLLTQLLEGIVHLGNNGISHRDIKSDNLFLELSGDDNSTPKLVIGDFGCCLADKEFGQQLPYFTGDVDRGGNCSLMAPEISTAKPGRDVLLDYSRADLWAVGTLIYELFGMSNPFYANESHGILDSRTYREKDLPSLSETVPAIVRSMTQMMLCRDPNKRISPVDASNLMQMFMWFPEWLIYKPSVTEVKEHLLVLTAQAILQCEDVDNEHQLMGTFLQRLNLNDLNRILDNSAETAG